MSRSIQLSDLPEDVYDWLRKRAETDGVSVSEWVRRELVRQAPEPGRLQLREWIEWLGTQEPLGIDLSASDIVEALHPGRAERF
jgi:hypothetical protein